MLARLAEMPLLVVLLGATGFFALLPAIHAVILNDHDVARGFFYSGLVLLILTVMLAIATAAYSPRNASRSHLAALAGAYLILPAAMALPVVQVLPDTSLINAWFEMVSAFTTTGASVYAPDRLPLSLHLWRATVGWFGGFFILLAAYSVLAPLNLGGAEVMSGRVPGRGATGTTQITRIAEPSQRITRYAVQIFPVYTALTLVLWVGLLISGDDGVTALTHAMGTLSTSGISAGQDVATSASGLPGEMLIFLFLIFAVTRRAFPGTNLAPSNRPFSADPELRMAAFLLVLVPLILFLRHWFSDGVGGSLADPRAALSALWGAVFTAASFLTTTGYESAYWSSTTDWSGLGAPGLVLLGLAIIGGGVATTAGGVKLLRVYALLRHGERELERIIHPSSIGGGGMDARRLRRDGAYMAWIFFMLFAMSIGACIATLALLGVEFEAALVLTIAALTTTGPLAQVATADPIPYAGLSDGVKLVLGFAMIVGRVEMLALIALFAPAGWRS
jgi:trk system potassium uptake protein